jgi:sterol desaturase/sphingolipid hydroxylase (fatty acid hydroxylase superfamily)
MVVSANTGCTPRLSPRPTLPSWLAVAKSAMLDTVAAPLFGAVLAQGLSAPYLAIAEAWAHHGWGDHSLFVVSTMVVHGAVYLISNLFTHYCDRTGYLEQYKLPRTAAMGPSNDLLHRTWWQAAFGQLVLGPVTLYYVYFAFKACGMPPATVPLPAFLPLLRSLMIAHIVNGWGFYWSHRALHSRLLYARVHKRHHEYTASVGFAAEYAHPFEQIVSNQGPTVLGCLLIGSHLGVWLVWLTVRLLRTYEGHCGYCFKGTWLAKIGVLHGSAYHDFHHADNRGNFGGPEYLDALCGTQDAWLKIGGTEGYMAQKRDKVKCINALRVVGAKRA